MSKKIATPHRDRYADALNDVLEFVRMEGASIDKAAQHRRLGASFLAGADLACRLIYDGVRSGLVEGFARRMRAHQSVRGNA